MTITFLGHSTFYLTLDNGTAILIDPWIEGNPSCPSEFKGYGIDKINYMLISHGHFDHIGDAIALAQKHEPVVVSNYEIVDWLGQKGLKRLEGVNFGGTLDFGSFKVTYVKAVHTSGITEADGSVVYGGVAGGFIIEDTNGLVLYFSGDTALTMDMQLVKELYQPKIAILPIGDRFTMGPRAAAKACQLIGCQFVIPCHYGTFPLLTGTAEQFEQEISKLGLSTQVLALHPGETLGTDRL